jgi:hypothetical protein
MLVIEAIEEDLRAPDVAQAAIRQALDQLHEADRHRTRLSRGRY